MALCDGFYQFLMMMYKGFLLRKRHYIVTAFEIIIPLLVACPIVFIRYEEGGAPNEDYFDPDYYRNATFYEPFSPFAPKTSYSPPNRVILLYSPNTTHSTALLEKAVTISSSPPEFTLMGYKTEKELEQNAALILGQKTATPVIGTVLLNFKDDDLNLPKSLDYKIRYADQYSYSNSFRINTKYSYEFYPRSYSDYTDTYFLSWQASVEQAFIALKSNKSEKSGDFQVMMNRFPYPPYESHPPGSVVVEMIQMFIVYGFIIYFCVLVKRVVVEKANHSKEYLKMMGMTDCIYWSSTFCSAFTFGVVILLAIIIMYTVRLSNGAKVFYNVDFGLLFVVCALYLASSILFCLTVTTFINRPNIAVSLFLILHVLSHSLLQSYYFLAITPTPGFFDLTVTQKYAMCLLPNGAIQAAFKILAVFEGPDGYEGWSSISSHGAIPDITLGDIMFMMVLSCVMYSIIIWYVDAVWPWQFGVPKKFYFPFTKSYWCGTAAEMSGTKGWESENEFFEMEPEGKTPGVVIRNLTKVFKVGFVKKKAVDNMSLNIYNGQITALLGRNGAGKTTTINILTGLFLPTKGSAAINGWDVRTQTKKARSSLGICPQHNVLYDTLTVGEHLTLYAGLKGVKWGELSEEVTKILKMLDLEDKRNDLSQSLSGGMKRKLSLGIAVIGGSKVLFLDEPTSGMDPEARRYLWDILLQIREDRTIVLTTHYMEEADILGDRIAIMADGKVQCCGSPMFLKKKYGTGYHIHMAKNSNSSPDTWITLLQKYFPATTLESPLENLTLTYCLGGETSGPVLGTMFQDLESQKLDLGIASFGITVTTMDDVFLKVSMLADEVLEKDNPALDLIESETTGLASEPSKGQYEKMAPSKELWIHQFQSLIWKRIFLAKRQWGVVIFQAIVPFLLTCLFLYTVRSIFTSKDPDPLKMDLVSVYGPTEGIYNFPGKTSRFGDSFYAPILQQNEVRATQVDDPNAFTIKMGEENINEFRKKLSVGGYGLDRGTSLNVTAWFNGEPYHILPMSLNIMHAALLRYFTGDSASSMSLTNYPLPTVNVISIANGPVVRAIAYTFLPLILSMWSACYVLVPIQECATRAKLLQLMTGISAFTYWAAMFLWDMLLHSAIVILLIVPFGIFAGYVFFPHPEALGSVILLLLLFGWSTFPICYLLSRCINRPATGFTLILSFTIIAGLILSLIFMAVEAAVGDNQNGVQITLYFLRLLPSFAITWGFGNLMSISYDNVFCEGIPEYALNAQCNQAQPPEVHILQCCKDICKDHCFKKTYPITWDTKGCGRDMFFLWFDGVLYFALLFLCETGIFSKAWSIFIARLPWKRRVLAKATTEGFSVGPDSDVQKEEDRIRQRAPHATDEALVVRDLTKWYKGICAVNGLTFGVHEQECFGLLGVNGAGKTSTFKMLTGDIFPTKGNAFIETSSIQTDLKKFQSFIGYCPQYDALIEHLSAREILHLFACLRGIPKHAVDSAVNSLILSVDLQDHADKQSRFYSGGNKRKLSLAMALIGTPSLILLDEPTAGVDPVSRRKIWNVLEETRNLTKSAIILCTHSMEECEGLCSRLAIMVNGQFRCLGSIQHLKSKYGLGYTVIIKLKREQSVDDQLKTNLQTHFQNTFPSANLKDDHQGLFHYHITDASISWSFLFNSVENMKQSFQFEDYLISGTTLEQIFLAFARSQRASGEAV